jgi:hypothetical protein
MDSNYWVRLQSAEFSLKSAWEPFSEILVSVLVSIDAHGGLKETKNGRMKHANLLKGKEGHTGP